MKAYLFPGQGAQTLQMSVDITAAFPASLSLYKEALNITGVDLLCLTEEQLSLTRYTQLAIIVHSVACLEKVHAEESAAPAPSGPAVNPGAVSIGLAGFSL